MKTNTNRGCSGNRAVAGCIAKGLCTGNGLAIGALGLQVLPVVDASVASSMWDTELAAPLIFY